MSSGITRQTVAVAVLLLAQLALCAPSENVERYHHSLSCYDAFRQCNFRFSGFNGIPTWYIGGSPNRAFTSKIISTVSGENLGVLNTNNIVPEFILNGLARPITQFGSQSFTPTHFKPFTIRYTKFSGVGHQTFQGNQLSVADGKCIRLYFTSYQLLDPYNHNVVGNRNNVPRSHNKCVVFWARA